ncbi:hypothetical protein FRC16_000312 [Serendipita sp. 398]|nr:hypothetical protein FRC16_000312 [Serendipita sp. 398]
MDAFSNWLTRNDAVDDAPVGPNFKSKRRTCKSEWTGRRLEASSCGGIFWAVSSLAGSSCSGTDAKVIERCIPGRMTTSRDEDGSSANERERRRGREGEPSAAPLSSDFDDDSARRG